MCVCWPEKTECVSVFFECLGGAFAGYFGLASVVGVLLARVLGDLASL